MLIQFPREAVDKLVVAVDAVTRVASKLGSELREAAADDDGKSGIGGAQTRAACGGAGRAQATIVLGMKTLVRRIEALGKTIPAVADFVDLVAAKGMHIRIARPTEPASAYRY